MCSFRFLSRNIWRTTDRYGIEFFFFFLLILCWDSSRLIGRDWAFSPLWTLSWLTAKRTFSWFFELRAVSRSVLDVSEKIEWTRHWWNEFHIEIQQWRSTIFVHKCILICWYPKHNLIKIIIFIFVSNSIFMRFYLCLQLNRKNALLCNINMYISALQYYKFQIEKITPMHEYCNQQ